MKKFGWIVLSLAFVFVSGIGISSCKKINEATELGGGLIPAVDNINTFETTLDVQSNNTLLLHDSTKIGYNTDVALGGITNDPVFGQTQASIYFDVLPQTSGAYPFFNKDSSSLVGIDSVVLSLSYHGAYGDTSIGSNLSVQVKEIAPSAKFNDSSFYRVDHEDFATTGVVFGSRTIAFNQLKDSQTIIRKVGDTAKTANELRVRLDPSIGQRFTSYDTTTAFKNDTAFRKFFSGFKVEAAGTTKAIGYFSLSDQSKTKLTFYYRTRKTSSGAVDTTSTTFFHYSGGSRANTIRRTRSGDFAAYLNNTSPNDDKLFIQAGSPGSIGTIRIPGLDTFSNKVIHRAELIISKLPSANENLYPAPPILFLDRVNLFDVGASVLDDFYSASASSSSQNLSVYGGVYLSDSTYRFNLTRHVQGIITRKETNYLLRLYAPLYTIIKTLPEQATADRVVNVLPQIAYGRVVLAGGSYADPAKKLRLRIIYSNIQ